LAPAITLEARNFSRSYQTGTLLLVAGGTRWAGFATKARSCTRLASGRMLLVADVSESSYVRRAMRVRLWVVWSSLGALSCGDNVVIARELAVQALSSEVADAGSDAGNHESGVPHESSEGRSATSTTRPSSKQTAHPVEDPHHASNSPTENSDGGSYANSGTGHH
jgi:hypothetical protein